MNTKSVIGKAAIIITIISLFSRFLGFLREILFANYYGTNLEYEHYLLASVIPLTINTISIFFYQNFFIPNHAIIKNQHPDAEANFIKKIFIQTLILSIIIVVFLLILRIQLLYLYVDSKFVNQELENLFIIFSLTVFPAIVSSFLSAYLNIKNKFSAPAYSLLFINIATIISLFYFKSENIVFISLGYLIGSYLQLLYLLFKVNVFEILKKDSSNIKKIYNISLGSAISVFLVEAIGQLYVVADRFFYAKVDSGGIAALNYATNVFLLPVSIFTFSITTAIMPKISEFSASEKVFEMANMLKRIISLSFYFFIPVVLVFILFGYEVVRIFFQRGSFDFNSTLMTQQVLFYLSLSLIFYVIYGVLNRYLYSLRKSKFLLYITIIIILTKVLLNSQLVVYLKQDGLAISTSISYLLFFILAFIKLKSELQLKLNFEIFSEMIFYLLNALNSYLISYVLSSLMSSNSMIQDILIIIIFFAIYFFNNNLFKDRNQEMILEQLNFFRK